MGKTIKKPKTKKGFTLLELVIVLAIIAVLLLLATSKYRSYVQQAEETHIIADTKAMTTTLEAKSANEKKDFIGKQIDKNTLKDKKIYSGRGLEPLIPEEVLYEVKEPKTHVNTVLQGKFLTTSDGEAYYVRAGKKQAKENKQEKKQKPETCPEDIYNNLKGNYRVIQHTDPAKVYLQKPDGTQIEVEKKCLNTSDLTPYNVINQNGKDGTVVLDYNTTPKYVIVKDLSKSLIIQKPGGNPKNDERIRVSDSTETFVGGDELEGKEVQIAYVNGKNTAQVISIVGEANVNRLSYVSLSDDPDISLGELTKADFVEEDNIPRVKIHTTAVKDTPTDEITTVDIIAKADIQNKLAPYLQQQDTLNILYLTRHYIISTYDKDNEVIAETEGQELLFIGVKNFGPSKQNKEVYSAPELDSSLRNMIIQFYLK